MVETRKACINTVLAFIDSYYTDTGNRYHGNRRYTPPSLVHMGKMARISADPGVPKHRHPLAQRLILLIFTFLLQYFLFLLLYFYYLVPSGTSSCDSG
jgi:hypothetical protein